MVQKAYTEMDHANFNPVSISGIQTRATDILHGTFRTELKLEGYTGGSCASFFWYHNDAQELDIEVVTPGTSVVNGTINYTTQPSTHADWSPIPNATQSMPLNRTLDDFRIHRFDCDPAKGVKYYLDDKVVHTDTHNVPKNGGSLQLKLWADGNRWWTGMPSKTDVHMRVKSIVAYYNTTSSHLQQHDGTCKPCKAVTSVTLPAFGPTEQPLTEPPSARPSAAKAPWGKGPAVYDHPGRLPGQTSDAIKNILPFSSWLSTLSMKLFPLSGSSSSVLAASRNSPRFPPPYSSSSPWRSTASRHLPWFFSWLKRTTTITEGSKDSPQSVKPTLIPTVAAGNLTRCLPWCDSLPFPIPPWPVRPTSAALKVGPQCARPGSHCHACGSVHQTSASTTLLPRCPQCHSGGDGSPAQSAAGIIRPRYLSWLWDQADSPSSANLGILHLTSLELAYMALLTSAWMLV